MAQEPSIHQLLHIPRWPAWPFIRIGFHFELCSGTARDVVFIGESLVVHLVRVLEFHMLDNTRLDGTCTVKAVAVSDQNELDDAAVAEAIISETFNVNIENSRDPKDYSRDINFDVMNGNVNVSNPDHDSPEHDQNTIPFVVDLPRDASTDTKGIVLCNTLEPIKSDLNPHKVGDVPNVQVIMSSSGFRSSGVAEPVNRSRTVIADVPACMSSFARGFSEVSETDLVIGTVVSGCDALHSSTFILQYIYIYIYIHMYIYTY